MSRTALRHLRLVGPLTMAAAFGLGSVPALAQSAPVSSDCSAIHFELANPSPGSRVEMGNTIVEGVATDKRAPDGLGIDRIDFFLDSREQGGLNIGSAAPEMTPGPFGRGSFEATLAFPNTAGGHDLVAYAHSAVTGQESIIAVPIAVGEDTSTAGLTLATSETQTCTQGGDLSGMMTPPAPAATTPATQPSTTTTTPAAGTTMLSPAASTMEFQVGNPSPNDTIHVGGVMMEGVAMDRAATQGSGIDRVDIFLDNRDAGGMMLTEATLGAANTWHALVTLPSNQTGLHNLSFYAHSSVTGQETLVTVPVTIAP